MNRREVGEGPRRTSNCFKDRDEELSFFRDMKKREFGSLLQPVSDEFEANNGKHGLYRMDSGGRKGAGLEFVGENGKNDYNWLKTPPATPLFPSLEMETKGQQLVIQREIPIIQHLSRFAGNSESNKKASSTPPNRNPKFTQQEKGSNDGPKNMHPTEFLNIKDRKQRSIASSTLKRDATQPNRPISTNQGLSTPQKQETNPNIRRQSCSPRGNKGNSDTDGKKGQVVGSRIVE